MESIEAIRALELALEATQNSKEILVEAYEAEIILLKSVGGTIATALVAAIGVLWTKDNKNNAHIKELNEYIREQNKSNLMLLADIAKNYEIMGVDVGRIHTMTSGDIRDMLISLKNSINTLLTRTP
jgi:uncharacterized protein